MSSLANNELLLSSTEVEPDKWQTRLSVPTMHCGGCMSKVETALMQLSEVSNARVNLTRKSVDVTWSGTKPPDLIGVLSRSGHEAHAHEKNEDAGDRNATKGLIRAVAVTGFATSNIMLLSVAVWSGANPELRDLFHWVSAAIALPTLWYSGQIFFKSAWSALRNWQTNMDVPISIGVVLAFAMSLFDTVYGQESVYFDASVMLLFFLLIGRTLDHMMREKAQNATAGMARLMPKGAIVVDQKTEAFQALDDIQIGAILRVSAGGRIPLDGRVSTGSSTLDCSLVTGESHPRHVGPGSEVLAGMLNLGGGLDMKVSSSRDDSFLSQTIDLMMNASSSRSSHRSIADRAAQLYAPFVHSAALMAFIVWFNLTGDWHRALTVAISVLIITCPCALGLAVPIVQVVASQRLFKNGVLVRDGSALERMQDIDVVVFDKTGTLTEGVPRLLNGSSVVPENLSLAASLATHSSHPYSRAIVEAARGVEYPKAGLFDITEVPGFGLEAARAGKDYRLGQILWALSKESCPDTDTDQPQVVLSVDGQLLETFRFEDKIRGSARQAINDLKYEFGHISLLSGDQTGPVKKAADALGIADYSACHLPADKVATIENLATMNHKVLMVGDGLNDAPALSAAHVSMAPSTAADVGRNNADFVFFNGDLNSIHRTFETARMAGRLIRQNFIIAIGYNILAIPVALLGLVTPMIAAIAMSISSIIVVVNALRLRPRETHLVSPEELKR